MPILRAPDTNGSEKKPSAFDYLTKLLLPLAGVVAAGLQREQAKLFVAFAVVSLGLGFGPAVAERVQKRRRRARDRKELQERWPRFKTLVGQFGAFVDPDRDTLHRLVRENFGDDAPQKLQFPPTHLLRNYWHQVMARLDHTRPTPDALVNVVNDFANVVNDYELCCVRPLFEDTLPPDLKPIVTAKAGRNLEPFRERFVAFRLEYEKFEKELAGVLRTVHLLPLHFQGVRPLVPMDVA